MNQQDKKGEEEKTRAISHLSSQRLIPAYAEACLLRLLLLAALLLSWLVMVGTYRAQRLPGAPQRGAAMLRRSRISSKPSFCWLSIEVFEN
jgi:hypothetical protein